ncbi:LpxI family protein [Ponticoccus alexandrii]|uniref:UDP-2,3-diacylglucosamine diphosphatase LpxI n=1 Tax=Ponticoccus alexandrii TaxID=1943633 RepID=A0ABX7F7S7_9RHOB|nr:UDP-2,3-diacylglucosamine diphosphatase LpxI [Ponticoccus alexandrii]ETA51677.1 phosphatidate cytidylyltransferase [Rhodobacteraceae bacterium PD-2]QRF66591.1 UDP-2,3-diacylglucosamine diphosphatase LpxI [Ponticoccus alexandrii]
MLAVIAGQGRLPEALIDALPERPLVCALTHAPPDRISVDHRFPIERLGNFLRWLRRHGVTELCMAGAVTRPHLRLSQLSFATLRLMPMILRALRQGDDGALRAAVSVIEASGVRVVGAHEIAPDLLPPAGVHTRAQPSDSDRRDVALGDRVSVEQGNRDLGQCCVLGQGRVLARETQEGTDAMLRALPAEARGGLFYKALKPTQDRRVDMPVVGFATARACIDAGLSGMVVEAGGVLVLDRAALVETLDAHGLFLWIRERPA